MVMVGNVIYATTKEAWDFGKDLQDDSLATRATTAEAKSKIFLKHLLKHKVYLNSVNRVQPKHLVGAIRHSTSLLTVFERPPNSAYFPISTVEEAFIKEVKTTLIFLKPFKFTPDPPPPKAPVSVLSHFTKAQSTASTSTNSSTISPSTSKLSSFSSSSNSLLIPTVTLPVIGKLKRGYIEEHLTVINKIGQQNGNGLLEGERAKKDEDLYHEIKDELGERDYTPEENGVFIRRYDSKVKVMDLEPFDSTIPRTAESYRSLIAERASRFLVHDGAYPVEKAEEIKAAVYLPYLNSIDDVDRLEAYALAPYTHQASEVIIAATTASKEGGDRDIRTHQIYAGVLKYEEESIRKTAKNENKVASSPAQQRAQEALKVINTPPVEEVVSRLNSNNLTSHLDHRNGKSFSYIGQTIRSINIREDDVLKEAQSAIEHKTKSRLLITYLIAEANSQSENLPLLSYETTRVLEISSLPSTIFQFLPSKAEVLDVFEAFKASLILDPSTILNTGACFTRNASTPIPPQTLFKKFPITLSNFENIISNTRKRNKIILSFSACSIGGAEDGLLDLGLTSLLIGALGSLLPGGVEILPVFNSSTGTGGIFTPSNSKSTRTQILATDVTAERKQYNVDYSETVAGEKCKEFLVDQVFKSISPVDHFTVLVITSTLPVSTLHKFSTLSGLSIEEFRFTISFKAIPLVFDGRLIILVPDLITLGAFTYSSHLRVAPHVMASSSLQLALDVEDTIEAAIVEAETKKGVELKIEEKLSLVENSIEKFFGTERTQATIETFEIRRDYFDIFRGYRNTLREIADALQSQNFTFDATTVMNLQWLRIEPCDLRNSLRSQTPSCTTSAASSRPVALIESVEDDITLAATADRLYGYVFVYGIASSDSGAAHLTVVSLKAHDPMTQPFHAACIETLRLGRTKQLDDEVDIGEKFTCHIKLAGDGVPSLIGAGIKELSLKNNFNETAVRVLNPNLVSIAAPVSMKSHDKFDIDFITNAIKNNPAVKGLQIYPLLYHEAKKAGKVHDVMSVQQIEIWRRDKKNKVKLVEDVQNRMEEEGLGEDDKEEIFQDGFAKLQKFRYKPLATDGTSSSSTSTSIVPQAAHETLTLTSQNSKVRRPDEEGLELEHTGVITMEDFISVSDDEEGEIFLSERFGHESVSQSTSTVSVHRSAKFRYTSPDKAVLRLEEDFDYESIKECLYGQEYNETFIDFEEEFLRFIGGLPGEEMVMKFDHIVRAPYLDISTFWDTNSLIPSLALASSNSTSIDRNPSILVTVDPVRHDSFASVENEISIIQNSTPEFSDSTRSSNQLGEETVSEGEEFTPGLETSGYDSESGLESEARTPVYEAPPTRILKRSNSKLQYSKESKRVCFEGYTKIEVEASEEEEVDEIISDSE